MGLYIFFSGQNGKKSVYTSLVLHDMYYFILNMFLEITIFYRYILLFWSPTFLLGISPSGKHPEKITIK
jgi:hypothetical protein